MHYALETEMSFTIAIVGRPNVGKSTLFNRLVGKKIALVDDQPGVTRDLREGLGKLGDIEFTVIDTAGLEDAKDESLQGRMRALTEHAVEISDICLFMIDSRIGVTYMDQTLATVLRKNAKNVLLVANKSEGSAGDAGTIEAWSLGLGNPISISAEHGEGMSDLLHALMPIADRFRSDSLENMEAVEVDVPVGDFDQFDEDYFKSKPLKIAVIGRPNAGKSTLINKILGEDRLLTGPEVGITRDAVSVSFVWNSTSVKFFDTAGMRKKAKVQDKIEKLSVSDGLRAVKFAEIVIILLDAEIPFEQQDLRIANLAEREGRAVVLAVNKWDLERNKQKKLNDLIEAFDRLLPQLKGAPLVTISAKTGKGILQLHEAVLRVYKIWNSRIPTAQLNQWLSAMLISHPPPAPNGRRIKMRYITQPKTRPPGFVVMCSNPEKVPESYSRYLVNGLREDFKMPGTPIRITLRSQSEKNPYKNKKKKSQSKLKKHLK